MIMIVAIVIVIVYRPLIQCQVEDITTTSCSKLALQHPHLAGDGATQDSPDGDFLHMLPAAPIADPTKNVRRRRQDV